MGVLASAKKQSLRGFQGDFRRQATYCILINYIGQNIKRNCGVAYLRVYKQLASNSKPYMDICLIINMSLVSSAVVLTRRCLFTTPICFFASKMQASSTQKTKDSEGRRLGIKRFGNEEVYPGDIIARQRGFKWHPGINTYVGKDHTIHSRIEGIVHFRPSVWRKRGFYYIDILDQQIPNRKVKHPMPYNYHPQLFPQRAAKNHPPVSLSQNKKVHFVQLKQ